MEWVRTRTALWLNIAKERMHSIILRNLPRIYNIEIMNDQSRDLRGRLRAINIGLPEKENRVNGRRSNI